MKARRLNEVRQLVCSPEFKAWWEAIVAARRALADARERHGELLGQAMLMEFRSELAQKDAIEALDASGEASDAVARMAVEVQELENASLQSVAAFEEQRFRASEAWYRACAAERRLDAVREQIEGARGSTAATENSEAELRRAERALAHAVLEDDRETLAKNRLWDEVERAWARSMTLDLLGAEKRVRGGRSRAQAERQFQESEQRRQRALQLRAEADAVGRECAAAQERIAGLLGQAAERFGALGGEDFVYFGQREDARHAWCVPLVEDSQGYNVEVRPLTVYSVDRKRGVEFIEPAVEAQASDAEADKRFESYFLEGRKGPGGGERRSA